MTLKEMNKLKKSVPVSPTTAPSFPHYQSNSLFITSPTTSRTYAYASGEEITKHHVSRMSPSWDPTVVATSYASNAALTGDRRPLPSPLVKQNDAPVPKSATEQYWAARALTAETLLSARMDHQREMKSIVSAEDEKKSKEMAALQRYHNETQKKMEYILIISISCILVLVSLIIYLLLDHAKTKPTPSKWGMTSHFTIPILSPWTSVVENEASVLGAKTMIAFGMIAAGLAYAIHGVAELKFRRLLKHSKTAKHAIIASHDDFISTFAIPQRVSTCDFGHPTASRTKFAEAIEVILPLWLVLVPSMQTLPPEVLSEIFLNCIIINAVTLPSRAPILLTRVNRLWRAVALSTPRLWSYLYLARSLGRTESSEARAHMPSDDGTKARTYITALRTWLSLSKRTPLTLRFWVHDIYPTSGDEDLLAEYMRILCTHSARWQDVDIYIPFNFNNFITILNQCRSLPLLESFFFDNERAISEPIDITILESAPLLRRARVTYPFLESWFVPWSQLTSLSIERCTGQDMGFTNFFDVDLFIEILSHCINLEILNVFHSFSCYSSIVRSTSTFAILPQLQNLNMVILTCDAEDDADEAEIYLHLLLQCLTHLVLPKLRTLELTTQFIYYRWGDSFLQFLAHFSESLEYLEFLDCSLQLDVATSMLQRLPNLTSLSISFFVTSRRWEGILRGLTLTSTADGNLNAKSVFYEALTTMIESRWQARSRRVLEVGDGANAPSGLTTLCLEEYGEKAMEKVAPSQRARIAGCVEEGLRLYYISKMVMLELALGRHMFVKLPVMVHPITNRTVATVEVLQASASASGLRFNGTDMYQISSFVSCIIFGPALERSKCSCSHSVHAALSRDVFPVPRRQDPKVKIRTTTSTPSRTSIQRTPAKQSAAMSGTGLRQQESHNGSIQSALTVSTCPASTPPLHTHEAPLALQASFGTRAQAPAVMPLHALQAEVHVLCESERSWEQNGDFITVQGGKDFCYDDGDVDLLRASRRDADGEFNEIE
ncbi:hypothetical protein EW146_g7571, partial [Bondarzewia mesenterica]